MKKSRVTSFHPIPDLKKLCSFAAVLFLITHVQAGEGPVASKETVPPIPTTEPDRWQFLIASPGLLAGLNGTVGINGLDADVDVDFDQIFQHLDWVFALRVEANKGRFGIYGELIYLSLSDGAQLHDRLVDNVAVKVDEYLADAGLSWRLVDKPRFSLDFVSGSRYTNLYQRLELTGRTSVITATSNQFVTDVSASLRDRLNNAISESGFISDVQSAISTRITNQLVTNLRDNQRSPSIPIAPLAGRHPEAIAGAVEKVIRVEEARIRAEVDALGLVGAARQAAVRQRVAARQAAIAQNIATSLQRKLNQSFARADYWFDPYVGMRGRYNFNKAFYTAVRGEIGGFGIGSDLMWQVEGVIGCNLTRNIFTEIGYRALSFDYESDGLTFDTITHGPQITTGIRF
jgi:hypothetical protein